MIAYFYRFSKRLNSTKQPSGGTEYDIVLKRPTSIHNPTVQIKAVTFDYNYMYIPEFSTYYWLSGDTRSIATDLWEADFKTDVLATFKSAIKSSSQYVLYDTTANTEIIDTRLNIKTRCTIDTSAVAFRSDYSAAGTFLLTVSGEGSVGCYAVPRSTLDMIYPDISTAFDAWIQSEDPFGAIKAGFMQLVSSGNLPENIKDIRWVPFAVVGETLVSPLKVGKYIIYNESSVPIGARRIDSRLAKETQTVNIPWQFNDWRNSEPYTRITLYIPFIGVTSFPASELQGLTSLGIYTSLDRYTGDIAVEVVAGDKIIGTYGASTGVSMFAGAGSTASPLNIVAGAAGVAAGIATGNLAAAATGITTAFKAIDSTIGGISNAAGAGLTMNVICTTFCHDTTDAPADVSPIMGTPAYEYKSLSSLTGYVQCSDATVSIAAAEDEIKAVNSYLNSGIYLE